MTVGELPKHLWDHWEAIREQLLAGTCQPQQVKRQEIPKRGGGVRQLGIPCVLDRFIQQAILQVLQPRFDPTFSEHGHGFRPGRRFTTRFVRPSAIYTKDAGGWSMSIWSLEANSALPRSRHYGHGGVMERYEGTPQGGPLSPLLANVLLDEVDREPDKRGLAFVRYADDCNVYLRSERAGERAMKTLRHLFANSGFSTMESADQGLGGRIESSDHRVRRKKLNNGSGHLQNS
jgi:RNA-directed DNA polymerase